MTPSRRAADALIGAWALDALEPAEAAKLDAMVADDEVLRRRAERLRWVAEELAAAAAIEPPPQVRADLLGAARARPRPAGVATDPIALFATQVDALGRLLRELDATAWQRPATPYRWSVHGLVAHLLVIERYMAGQLGLTDRRPGGAHLALGAAEIEVELARAPEQTAAAWATAAETTIEWLGAGSRAPDEPVELHGWPFNTSTLLVARAFEVWTHADDIRRATGRPVVAPDAADLRAMSRFSVTSLPLVLPLAAPGARFEGARVVLTGDGGGTYDLGAHDRREALLVVDVVDYCRHAARRIDRQELAVTVEGDAVVAHRLLDATQVFAV